MKVSVIIGESEFHATIPFDGADHVVVDGMACPACANPAPLKVRGGGIESRDHDSETAIATALCCGAPVGQLWVTFSTVFGIEEDRAVLNGRPRVY